VIPFPLISVSGAVNGPSSIKATPNSRHAPCFWRLSTSAFSGLVVTIKALSLKD